MDSLSGTREAPGKQERTNWIACKYQGGTREAGKDQLDILRCTREAPGRQERTTLRHQRGTRETRKDQLDSLRGTREAPGRQERTNWTAWEAPERHQGGQKCKELNNQITASIFWKKNAPRQDRHRY